MRSTFICALILFFIFLLVTFAMPPRASNTSYFAALKDKHRRLEKLSSPKIIFVGGSNLAFGLDCNVIEKTLHIPVVNMGLCSTFGPRYYFEEIKDNIKAGDTIVIIPEYISLSNITDGDRIIIHALEVYPTSALFVLRACASSSEYTFNLMKIILASPAAKWKALFSALDKMRKKGRFDLGVFNPRFPARYYFDRYGDFFYHIQFREDDPEYVPYLEPIRSISSEAAEVLDDFDKFVQGRGARVVMIPPPLPMSDLHPTGDKAPDLANWPGKKINIPILARPERYVFANSDFYELPYHLNLVGRTKRTALVIEDLQKYFDHNSFRH